MIKLLKYTHIGCANILKTAIVLLIFIVLLKPALLKQYDYKTIDYILYIVSNLIINNAFYAISVTAFLYALFTPWGFFRHQWIIFKWLLVFTGFALFWFKLGPIVNDIIAISDAGTHQALQKSEYQLLYQKLLIYSIIQAVIFGGIFLISRFKIGKK